MKKIIGAAAAALAPTVLFGAPALAAGANTASATAAVNATIIRPISVAKTADLKFGTFVRPASGSNTVTVSTAGVRSVAGGGNGVALASTAAQAAAFTVSGEGGQAFTLVVPGNVTMNNTSGTGSVNVTTSNNEPAGCPSACVLSGNLGDVANGNLSFNVGGNFTVTSATNTGAYAGNLTVTATYN